MKKYRYFHFYDPEKIANLCPDKRQIAAMESWMQTSGCRLQVARRFARFKARVEQYWKLYPWLMCVAICATLMSCAHTQYVVPNDTITSTTTKTKTIERDSIFVHDSIYVREYIQGDTVFRDKLVEHWKDRWLTRTDTLMRCDTVRVTLTKTQTITEQVKVVPGFYKWCTAILILLVIGIIVKIATKLFV